MADGENIDDEQFRADVDTILDHPSNRDSDVPHVGNLMDIVTFR